MTCAHNCPMFDGERAGSMEATLARIEAAQEGMRKELLGNGQPGRIQRIEAKVEEGATFIQRVKGVLILVGGIGGVVGFFALVLR